ncbi:MAG TPA: GTP-binding protein [Candidatus Saccharimonadia bacterium]
MAEATKIPITALTGFLGSGKTTLLNYILEHNHGLKIGVVVNDYGSVNIDAQLIAGKTDTMLELTNGCICCSMEGLELDEAIGQFAYPGTPIDYIVIEASGLAEPADLARTLREAAGRFTMLDSIVAVIDAMNAEENAEGHATALQQIEYSDFVIINKIDLVSAAKVEQLSELARGINPRVRIFTAVKGVVDVRLLLDQGRYAAPPTQLSSNGHAGHKHLHDHYATFSYATNKPLSPQAFQSFVNLHIPTSVYRAKGIVNLGNKGRRRKYIFQLVGKRAELTWDDWGAQQPSTDLVFIGRDFNEDAIRKLLEACIDDKPNEHDPAQEVVLPKRQR